MNKTLLNKILKNMFFTLLFAGLAIGACYTMMMNTEEKNDILISSICIFSGILTACLTDGYLYPMSGNVIVVVAISLLFTSEQTDYVLLTSGVPFLLSLLIVSFTTSTMKQFLAEKERIRSESEKERLRGNLLRAISHDIRTPLTSIMGASSAILENSDTLDKEKQLELVKSINDEASWLIRMVENLLTVTRINGEIGELKTQNEIAEEIVSSAVNKFRSRFKTPTVSIEIPDELLIVPMDSILIEQVLRNFMENVVKHSKNATKIIARLKKEGDFAVFEIEDNGDGIAEEKLKAGIFSGTLSQGEVRSGDSSRNMGIGLSVCATIVKAHKGTTEALNTENGALFRFKLPLADDNMEDRLNG